MNTSAPEGWKRREWRVKDWKEFQTMCIKSEIKWEKADKELLNRVIVPKVKRRKSDED